LIKKFRLGRAQRLNLFLGALALGTVVFALVNAIKLNADYQDVGGWSALLKWEWASGRVVTSVLGSGLFQIFIIVLGWSRYFRVRSREHAHIRLRRSEQKYRAIINHAGEAIFLLDYYGRVLEWSKASEVLFGLSRRQVLNQPLQVLDLDLGLTIEDVMGDVSRSQKSLTYQVNLTPKTGPNKILNMTFSRIGPGAGFLAEKEESFVVIASDITSELQFESRMSEAEKLAGIGQIAAGMAHQLNTPLGSILLSAQMLEETIDQEDDVEDLHRIIRQTEQCRQIIKGLLNFARPTGGGRAKINVGAIIKETVFLMEKSLTVAGVEADLESVSEEVVYGNRNELEQVFFNLLANALDAMPGGGKVVIAVEDGERGEIKITFSDSGDGIEQLDHDRIFLPFFTTKAYGKGTGLGLAIVSRIIHEHGGRINVKSRKNSGTEFLIILPRARKDLAKPSLIDDGE
jgi:PAS domain S-box-containing protein